MGIFKLGQAGMDRNWHVKADMGRFRQAQAGTGWPTQAGMGRFRQLGQVRAGMGCANTGWLGIL